MLSFREPSVLALKSNRGFDFEARGESDPLMPRRLEAGPGARI